MADKIEIGMIKEQLHDIYDQVTAPAGSGTRNGVSTGPNAAARDKATTSSGLGLNNAPATGSGVGLNNEPTTNLGLGMTNEPTTTSSLASGTRAPKVAALGTRNDIATASDLPPRTEAATTESVIGSRADIPGASSPEHRPEAVTASALGPRNEALTEANTAHPTNLIAATGSSARDDSRRASDVGPRNETTPMHHQHDHDHHHHHHETKDLNSTSSTTKNGGITYGNVSHLGVSPTPLPPTDGGPRRHSLAASPYRGRIDSTVSPTTPGKKWSFSMGNFGLKLPKQASNATAQELNRDGSVSMQGGQGRVPRGIGSISSNVKRGSVDATVSPRDPAQRWSFAHGDFGLRMPRQESNAVAQELNRDKSVSLQGGLGPAGAGPRTGSTGAVSLGRQGARGIGSISSSVRKGSVDVNVSEHDKARKWSFNDADFGLKWPKQPSNLH